MRIAVGCVPIVIVAAGMTACQPQDDANGSGAHAPAVPPTLLSTPFESNSPDVTGSAPEGLPGIPCGETKGGVRTRYLPVEIAIACGDNGIRATRLRWQGWTASRALAHGVLVQNDCKPTCLGGHLLEYPGARFEFLGPVYDHDFSTVVVTFASGRSGPEGQRRLIHRL